MKRDGHSEKLLLSYKKDEIILGMHKPKKKVNTLDVLIEKLIDQFSKVKNFDLLQTDSVGNTLFNIIAFRLADISSYKDLVVYHFVPAANKAIFQSKESVRTSRYKELLRINDRDYHETTHQTVRLAYVALFHKIESFLNDILEIADIINEQEKFDESIEKYAKRKFGFQFRDWQQFSATSKINWICNCVKHYDGFPKKEPKPANCKWYPDTIRLQLTVDEFKTDTEMFLQFCTTYLTFMFLINSFRQLEHDFENEFWKKQDSDFINQQRENLNKVKVHINDLINQVKKLEENLNSIYE